jgi:hypothetical protein
VVDCGSVEGVLVKERFDGPRVARKTNGTEKPSFDERTLEERSFEARSLKKPSFEEPR